jgi:hypothetical protein
MRAIFLRRGILQLEEVEELSKPRRLYDHFKVDVFHRIESITQSRAAAYRFLDDNRRILCIPSNQDFMVADLYEVNKYSEVAHRLPRQYVLEYLWREEVELRGSQYGRLDGQLVAMLCGGTLVFDDRGNNLSRFQKHGSHLDPSQRNQKAAKAAAAQGKARLAQFKADIARNVQLGLLGVGEVGASGLVSSRIAPFITRHVNGATRFELSAHLSLSEESRIGERSWQISS